MRFTPSAWAKLLYLRDLGPTEIGGFGISSAEDPLLVEEFWMVKQYCQPMTVQFDAAAVADYFDQQVDRGLTPERFARIWIHTHPGTSPHPSGIDEETFATSFAGPDWAIMAILARGGATYARLRFNIGPGGDLRLDTAVDYTVPFRASDQAAWKREYDASLLPDPSLFDDLADDPADDLETSEPIDGSHRTSAHRSSARRSSDTPPAAADGEEVYHLN